MVAADTPSPKHSRRPSRPERLALAGWGRGRDRLTLTFAVDDQRFETSYTWPGVDLPDLERSCGREALERLYLHIAAFEAIPLASLRPRTLDLGPLAHLATPALEELWRAIYLGVSAQWRWENGLAGDRGPRFERQFERQGAAAASPPRLDPAAAAPAAGVLFFNGGGKDSLVAMRLLERAGIAYASAGYAHSAYGGEALQHELIDDLTGVCAPLARHRWEVRDELWADADAVARAYGVRGLICCETPISVFAALPLALREGYRSLVLGNERSADSGNFVWSATGEEVNHQWGKSLAAQRLQDRYLRRHLAPGLSYWSALKPLSDVVIFNLLRGEGDAVRRAHSCSVAKPWCERCPKCAYVGASYLAYLEDEQVEGVFRSALLDTRANREHFRALLGLGRPKPFECVGEVGETRLAFELCRRRGRRGRALDDWAAAAEGVDVERALARYAGPVDTSSLPAAAATALGPQLERGVAAARSFVRRWLEAAPGGA